MPTCLPVHSLESIRQTVAGQFKESMICGGYFFKFTPFVFQYSVSKEGTSQEFAYRPNVYEAWRHIEVLRKQSHHDPWVIPTEFEEANKGV